MSLQLGMSAKKPGFYGQYLRHFTRNKGFSFHGKLRFIVFLASSEAVLTWFPFSRSLPGEASPGELRAKGVLFRFLSHQGFRAFTVG
jgi:hypothetical protein